VLKRNRRRPAVFLAIVSLIAGGIVVAPSVASAQSGATDQYSGQGPAGGSGDGPGGDIVAAGAGAETAGTAAGTAESGGADLPFTGYPMTPLAVVFLLLLGAGIVIRIAGARRTGVTGSTPGARVS
jgi:hypothetical protein